MDNIFNEVNFNSSEYLSELELISQQLTDATQNHLPIFGGERYLSDAELSSILKISRRTLQTLRSLGVLPFYLIGGKVLYKESDIQRFLDERFQHAFA